MEILIIEDKDIDQMFIRKTLEFSGEKISLDSANTLKSGVEKIHAKTYDCILLDLHLPDGEDHKIFDTVYELVPSTPIILLTGSEDSGIGLELIDKGAQDYISKEKINSQDLVKAIKFAIRRIKTDNKLRELIATKDKFFSIMAHDLKNPLSIFAVTTQTLHKEVDVLDKEELKEYLDHLKDNAKSIYDLLENLLTWSRTQRKKITFQPEIIELNFIIKNNIDLFSSTARAKNIELIAPRSEAWTVYSDSNLINTILRNLVNNALKFTPEGGKVEILVESEPNYWVMKVSDNGIGMDSETIENLFKVEVNTSKLGTNNEGGTGLGLIVCKEFADIIGGDIWVESELGKGSTFSFSIPKT
jgi:signal transduction histidine kinase